MNHSQYFHVVDGLDLHVMHAEVKLLLDKYV